MKALGLYCIYGHKVLNLLNLLTVYVICICDGKGFPDNNSCFQGLDMFPGVNHHYFSHYRQKNVPSIPSHTVGE